MNMNILCINESVTAQKQKAADGMASAVDKHLGPGGILFCFRRIRLCLDWGFDLITATTGCQGLSIDAIYGIGGQSCCFEQTKLCLVVQIGVF